MTILSLPPLYVFSLYKQTISLTRQALEERKKLKKMASLSLSPVQLLAVVLAITASFCKIEEVDGTRDGRGVLFGYQREFDYFNLALQWPGTVCRRTRRCCSSNACCRGYPFPRFILLIQFG